MINLQVIWNMSQSGTAWDQDKCSLLVTVLSFCFCWLFQPSWGNPLHGHLHNVHSSLFALILSTLKKSGLHVKCLLWRILSFGPLLSHLAQTVNLCPGTRLLWAACIRHCALRNLHSSFFSIFSFQLCAFVAGVGPQLAGSSLGCRKNHACPKVTHMR